MFRKYALKLVNAAIRPLLDNKDIMTAACECTTVFDKEEQPIPVDAVLATMSIAKDHYEDFQIIQNTSDFSQIKDEEGLMENIRKILAVLRSSRTIFEKEPGRQVFNKYLIKFKQDPSDTAGETSTVDRSIRTAIKCFRSILSMGFEDNEKFFDPLTLGFKVANASMNAIDKDFDNDPIMKERRALLDTIIEKISKVKLRTPDIDYEREQVVELVDLLMVRTVDLDTLLRQ